VLAQFYHLVYLEFAQEGRYRNRQQESGVTCHLQPFRGYPQSAATIAYEVPQ
ncbi:uncharacterized protein METZ01_LOCUS241350, partial [marine metagenome]